MLFRDRPVLEHIVEQHAEEAAFLWTLRDAATEAPHYKRHHLARLDERVEAHVDGLRVAREAGWRIALEQMERRCESGELFAAGVLALESGDMSRIEPLIARAASAQPDVRRGFVGAIAWCEPRLLADTVRIWERSAEALERYLALCACSVHRAEPGTRFPARLDDADALVRARALRLAGELGKVEHLEACLRHLDDESDDAAFWAAWSGVLLGDRGVALRALQSTMVAESPYRWIALEVGVRAMADDHGADFIRGLNADQRLRRAVVAAVGHLGDSTAVPWLIDRMQEPDVARAAGESFTLITGADVTSERLEDNGPPKAGWNSATNQTDGPLDLNAGAYLAPPDPMLVHQWWNLNGYRLQRGKRYIVGEPINKPNCESILQTGFQRHRRAAAYELALAASEESLVSIDATSPLGRMRNQI